MIRELAEFEHAADECTVTESQITRSAFRRSTDGRSVTSPRWTARPAAVALWFRNFSTWDGVAGVYLEDLFVRPTVPPARAGPQDAGDTGPRMRRQRLHAGCRWAVLDWNVNAIALYDAVGGKPMSSGSPTGCPGPELSALAAES